MGATGTSANSAYLAINSAMCHRPWRWTPGGPNRRGQVIGLLWITAKVGGGLSRNFAGRRKTIFDVEHAKTSANQGFIRLGVIKKTTVEVATVNNNYCRVYPSVAWDKSSPV
jgi:hypothetical protein